MPIQSLTRNRVLQHCIACGESRDLDLEQLEVGIFDGEPEGAAATVVTMPPCSRCASVEFLIGSSASAPEDPQPGSYGHLHRLLVDRLHADLIDLGRVAPDSQGRELRLRRPGTSELERWFPNGLVIEPGTSP